MDEAQVLTLLKIVDLAKQWPSLNGIHNLAMAELEDINKDALVSLGDRAKALAASDRAKADARIKAQAKADADAAAPKPVAQPNPAPRVFVPPADAPAPAVDRRDA